MNDDEVKQWLTPMEAEFFPDGDVPAHVDALRILAETRKALARLEETARYVERRVDAEVPRPHTPDVPGHLRGALQAIAPVLTAMPRPR